MREMRVQSEVIMREVGASLSPLSRAASSRHDGDSGTASSLNLSEKILLEAINN